MLRTDEGKSSRCVTTGKIHHIPRITVRAGEGPSCGGGFRGPHTWGKGSKEQNSDFSTPEKDYNGCSKILSLAMLPEEARG